MFQDNVDFVLVWDSNSSSAKSEEAKETRNIFESNLEQEGLVLSRYEHTNSEGGLHFVNIFAPDEVLKRYAEILKLRLPMKKVRKVFNSAVLHVIWSALKFWLRLSCEYFRFK